MTVMDDECGKRPLKGPFATIIIAQNVSYVELAPAI
jgi:hypothetical protein